MSEGTDAKERKEKLYDCSSGNQRTGKDRTGQSDRWKYRMDHAVTATQKIILKAFDMDADQIQDKAIGLSRLLEKYAEEGK